MPATNMALTQAAEIIQDGQTIALGGMTMYRRPVAFVRALLRRDPRPQDLTLLCFTAGYESDLLVGAGCVRTMRSVYFGLEAFGLAPMFTTAAQRGEVHILEETEASIVMGMRARMGGVGFMPSLAWIGTDLPRLRPDVKTIVDPYTGEELTAFPAINLDVAILHGLEADRHGNVKLNYNQGIDMELAYIAKTVIVTVERLIDAVKPSPEGPVLPAPGADIIVHAAQGAWPTSCYPLYPIAGGELIRYTDMCNAGAFDSYLNEFINDPRSDPGQSHQE
jgi:glutaconate CoA-transferase, subunit A